ncbi:HYC_CC_PP family protein [Pedobacter nutrimenti]|uniref:Uncharacterized protein n=1 Tax=Pedobacter nutrimenti TaxID=1241337 RepID=A0A318UHY1_9SPHI|nr:hypothetical protein [Pedobacter nutrimenti]PYF74957.1 hypothetical protein B0O44_103403 [Pedobacter nutrimenti]
MKRTLLTILAIFYLGTSSGMTVHFHYCMGKLVEWSLSQPDQSICGFCKTPKKTSGKSCCKDDYKQAKIDKAQKTAASVYQFKQIACLDLNTNLRNAEYVALPIQTGKAALSNAPPLTGDIPIFIRNCNYRI